MSITYGLPQSRAGRCGTSLRAKRYFIQSQHWSWRTSSAKDCCATRTPRAWPCPWKSGCRCWITNSSRQSPVSKRNAASIQLKARGCFGRLHCRNCHRNSLTGQNRDLGCRWPSGAGRHFAERWMQHSPTVSAANPSASSRTQWPAFGVPSSPVRKESIGRGSGQFSCCCGGAERTPFRSEPIGQLFGWRAGSPDWRRNGSQVVAFRRRIESSSARLRHAQATVPAFHPMPPQRLHKFKLAMRELGPRIEVSVVD